MMKDESPKIAFGELCRLTRYHAPGVRAALAGAGLSWTPGPGNRRLYDRQQALDAVDVYRGGAGRLSVVEARAKRMHCEAELARLKVEKLAASLVSADEAAAAWRKYVDFVRERALQLPATCAPDVARASDLRDVEQRISAEIFALLEELSSGAGTE